MRRWKLTVRTGPKVQRNYFDELEKALSALERRARELSSTAADRPVDAKFKRFEPVERVSARLEVSGPERLIASVRGGIDVRGDGSVEAYQGRIRREVIEPRKGENAYAALRRALAPDKR